MMSVWLFKLCVDGVIREVKAKVGGNVCKWW